MTISILQMTPGIMNIFIRIISFCLFSIGNSYIVEGLNVNFLKSLSFIFVELLLVLGYLGWYDNKEMRYRAVVFENINLYNRLMHIQSEKEELMSLNKDVEFEVKEKILEKLITYQKKMGMCQFPLCLNLKEEKQSLCDYHLKYRTDECGICFEKIENDVTPLSCGHFLHKECFNKLTDKKCPFCKEEHDYFR